MPSRLDHHHASAIGEAGEEIVGQPAPGFGSDGFRLRLSASFDWVIHNTNIETEPSNFSRTRGITKAPALTDEFQKGGCTLTVRIIPVLR